MAQYYQVFDTSQVTTDDQQVYQNVVDIDNQSMQYIIQTEHSQSTPYVLVEQSGGGAPVLQQFNTQPVYLLESPTKAPSMQPFVLNHTLQQKVLIPQSQPMPVIVNAVPQRQQLQNRIVNPPPQILNNRLRQPNMRNAIGGGGNVRMQRNMNSGGVRPNPGPGIRPMRPANVNVPPARMRMPVSNSSAEMVKLADGRIVTMGEYQILKEQKKQQQIEIQQRQGERLTGQRPGSLQPRQSRPPLVPMNPRPMGRPPIRPPLGLPLPPLTPVINANTARKPANRIILPNQSARLPRVLRDFCVQPEIRDIINRTINDEEFENSIRMFVLLSSGEQRLITFTTPKEDCTIQEILEQVGVPLEPDTKIAITEPENPKDGIDIVVSVGYDDEDEEVVSPKKPPAKPMDVRPPTPEPSPEPPVELPKLIPGKMAVCNYCGILSEDFNKCQRCLRKLPDGIKAVSMKRAPCVPPRNKIAINLKSTSAATSMIKSAPPTLAAIVPKGTAHIAPSVALAHQNAKQVSAIRKLKPKLDEPVIVTLSSDDEDEEDSNDSETKGKAAALVEDKEPTLEHLRLSVIQPARNPENSACTTFSCRTIRIGSYRFIPTYDVIVNVKELIMRVVHPVRKDEVIVVALSRKHIIKVLVSFQKLLPVIFYYVSPVAAQQICKLLSMSPEGQHYFNPLSEDELQRRIVLLPYTLGEEDKWVLNTIYGEPLIIEEVNPAESNAILMKTCSKDIPPALTTNAQMATSEVRKLFIYPPGTGGITINTEDYMCLERDQFLNDVIIDFYLKYLIDQLPIKQKAKVHVFSTFFYNRLTTKAARSSKRGLDALDDKDKLTAAHKRHARVKNWTKNVDLFDKDFIIIPINENAHWFLAIICFPGMKEPKIFDAATARLDKTPDKIKTKKTSPIVTPMKTRGNIAVANLEADSDKDEAEGDESELEMEDQEPEPDQDETRSVENIKGITIKQPCILIFDSLAGASRSRVVATLRDYLTCEYNSKKNVVRTFTKHVIHGACPKIPQQNNYTDCGLYLLQYVEAFFQTPIRDFRLPIKGLKEWFDETVVTRKREDITNLIKDLMIRYKKDVSLLPPISLPTENGQLVDCPSDEDEEMAAERNNEEKPNSASRDQDANSMSSNNGSNSDTESNTNPKTDNRQSAMSYLKAKRIVKVKSESGSGIEPKRQKTNANSSGSVPND